MSILRNTLGTATSSPLRSVLRGSVSAIALIPVITAVELYLDGFTTDRSADFDNPVVWSQTASAFDAASPALGATSMGALHFGDGASGIIEETITRTIEGEEAEFYWIQNQLDPTNAGYTGYPQLRTFVEWLDDSDALVGARSGNLAVDMYGSNSYVATKPVGATKVRMVFQRRTAPWAFALYYLQIFDITESGSSPVLQDIRPDQFAVVAYEGSNKVLDFANTWSPAPQSIEIVSAPPEMGASVNGTTLILNPPIGSGITLPLAAGVGQSRSVLLRAVRGTQKGFDPIEIDCYPQAQSTLELRKTPPTISLEDGHFISLDPIGYIKGGAYPYTCVIDSKPSWLLEGLNGHVAGLATGSGAQTPLSATVTDAVGNTINVVVPINIVALDRSAPQVITVAQATASGIWGQVSLNPTGPTVVQLEAGVYPLFGSIYNEQRDHDKPVIFMGASGGGTIIRPKMTVNRSCGLWFEDITFQRVDVEDMGNVNSLNNRAEPDVTTSALLTTDPDYEVAPSFNRFNRCNFNGYVAPDLSLETEADAAWFTRDGGGGVPIYSDTGTLFTSGRWSQTTYGGGADLQGFGVVQDCHAEGAVFPYSISGPMCGLYNNTANQTRTDQLRFYGAWGSAVWGHTVGANATDVPWLNSKANEHQDCIQSVAPSSKAVGERVWIKDVFINGMQQPGVQGIQLNMGTAGSFDKEDPPTLWAIDWLVEDCFLVTTLINGLNAPGFNGKISNTTFMPDPLLTNPVTSAVAARVRIKEHTTGELTNSMFGAYSLEEPTPRIPWTLTNNYLMDGQAAEVAASFPNLYTSPATNDPRVGGSAARFYRDNTAGRPQGPLWLTP